MADKANPGKQEELPRPEDMDMASGADDPRPHRIPEGKHPRRKEKREQRKKKEAVGRCSRQKSTALFLTGSPNTESRLRSLARWASWSFGSGKWTHDNSFSFLFPWPPRGEERKRSVPTGHDGLAGSWTANVQRNRCCSR